MSETKSATSPSFWVALFLKCVSYGGPTAGVRGWQE